MPTPFEFLLQLQERGDIRWPIDLEIADEPSEAVAAETMDAWFDGKDWRGTGHKVVMFAEDGTGGLFGLWHYPELKGEPPVVLLGSEGETGLLANDLADFVQLTCSGLQWYGFEGAWTPIDPDEIDEDDDDPLDLAALRTKADEALGPMTETAAAIHARATENHPDFTAWVEALLA